MYNTLKNLNNVSKSEVEHKLRQLCQTNDRYLAYSTLMLDEDGKNVEYVTVYDLLALDNIRDVCCGNNKHLRYIIYPIAGFNAEPDVNLSIQVANCLDEYVESDWQSEQNDTGYVQVYLASTDCLVGNTEPYIEILSDALQPPSINVESICGDGGIRNDDLARMLSYQYDGRCAHERFAAIYGKYVNGAEQKTRIYLFDRQDIYNLLRYCDGNTGREDGYCSTPFKQIDIDYTEDQDKIRDAAHWEVPTPSRYSHVNIELIPASGVLREDDDIRLDLEI